MTERARIRAEESLARRADGTVVWMTHRVLVMTGRNNNPPPVYHDMSTTDWGWSRCGAKPIEGWVSIRRDSASLFADPCVLCWRAGAWEKDR
jgi:hypothetical protein